MKMVASERQVVTPEEKAVERRVSRVIRRSMTANSSLGILSLTFAISIRISIRIFDFASNFFF